jgi:hypothetical protein
MPGGMEAKHVVSGAGHVKAGYIWVDVTHVRFPMTQQGEEDPVNMTCN